MLWTQDYSISFVMESYWQAYVGLHQKARASATRLSTRTCMHAMQVQKYNLHWGTTSHRPQRSIRSNSDTKFIVCEVQVHSSPCKQPVPKKRKQPTKNQEVCRRFPCKNSCIDFDTSTISGLLVGSSFQHTLMNAQSWLVTNGVEGLRGFTPLCTSMTTCASRRRYE